MGLGLAADPCCMGRKGGIIWDTGVVRFSLKVR